MVISNSLASVAMKDSEIIKNFSTFCKGWDGSKVSAELIKEIKNLCRQYPIIGVLCAAMYNQGYESF